MNILVVSNLYPPHYLGGYELACAGVVGELRRRGHRVDVLTSRHGAERSDPEAGVHRVLDIGWPFQGDERADARWRSLFYNPANRKSVRALIRSARPDVLYAWHLRGLGALQILFAAWRARVPVVIHHMDYWMVMLLKRSHGRPTLVGHLVQRWLSGCLRPRMIFTSRRVRQEFLDHGWNAEGGVVIRHGEDPDRVPQADRRERTRHLWRFVFASQIILIKGIDLVIEALRSLVFERGRGDFILDVIGEGSDMGAVRTLVAQARIGGYVRFLGKIPHEALLRRLAEYDMLLFPTHAREPGGNIVVEAMMAGCVVLTSDVGGQSELIQNGLTGYTLPRDSAALSRRIHALMCDQEHFLKLSANAARHARSELSLSRIADQIEQVIQEAVQLSSTPASGRTKLVHASGGERALELPR